METCETFVEYSVPKKIKKEPDASETICSSNIFDDTRENVDPQKYIYKEELDLEWDEKDNNYGITHDNSEESKLSSVKDNQSIDVFHHKNSEPSKINVKIENPDIERGTDVHLQGEMNEHSNLQKYYYKEELDLDWNEKDNFYDENHESFIEKTIESDELNKAETKTSDSRNETFGSKKKIENPDTAQDCPKCNKRLKNLNTLKKHVYYCGKVPHLQCDSCSYKAKYKNALIMHIIKNHPQQISNLQRRKFIQKTRNKSKSKNKNKNLKEQQESDKCLRFCISCNISTDKSTLNKCNKCKSFLLYQCRKCKEPFATREKLIRHILDICDPRGYFHCPACEFKATHRRDVKNHLRVHLIRGSDLDTEDIKWKRVEKENAAAESYSFECPSCFKQFQRKASLASHMRFCIKSQGVSKPPKHYVEKRDPGIKRMISKHCIKCHNKILSNALQSSDCCGSPILFTCMKCNKSYERVGTIYPHVRECCSIKQKCDLCNYEGTERNLALHRQNRHNFDTVECPKCKGKFKNKNTLRHHSYQCGIEPFKCDLCSYKTKRKYELDKHIFNCHGIDHRSQTQTLQY